MKKSLLLICTFLFCLSLPFAVFAQTKLKAVGEEDESEAAPETEPAPEAPAPFADSAAEPEQEKADKDHWNTFLGSIFGDGLQGIGLTFSDAVFKDRGLRYRAYPYSKENYIFSDKENKPRGAPGVTRIEYQRIAPDLYSVTWRLCLRMTSGFDFSVTVRPGMGYTAFDNTSGIDIGLEIDCFPQDPFTFHAGVCHTFITNHHGITDIDVALGVMLGPFEFSLGYRGLNLKDENINGIYISVGFWF